MKASVFVGTSVDGFIARPNGDLDFLSIGDSEPHGFEEFIAQIDTVVMGRKTFETVLSFIPPWPYGTKRVVVLSSTPLNLLTLPGIPKETVEQMSGPPSEVITRLATSGAQHLYIDGGITVQRFLRAGLIQNLTITQVPILIGQGIPLFGSLPNDLRLRHIATRHYSNGLVQTQYEVIKHA